MSQPRVCAESNRWMSVADAANAVGIDHRNLRVRMSTGSVRFRHINGRPMIRSDEVVRLWERQMLIELNRKALAHEREVCERWNVTGSRGPEEGS